MISAIVAVDNNFGIGSNGDLLCSIKEDLAHFKKITTNNIVIMGRKTWDSLPKKPLPNRINIVITNSFEGDYFIFNSVVYAKLDFIKRVIKRIKEDNDIFVIGGGQIYKELLPYCEYIHLTKIHKSFDNVDTYFPNIDKDENWEVYGNDIVRNDNGVDYQFCIYKNKGEIE